MKRVLFLIVAEVFIFSACEDGDKRYSNEQLNALNKLKGNYHAYFEREMILSVVSFTAHYSIPHAMYDDNEKTVLFYTHGECYFSDSQYFIPEKGYITCYYAYSKNADTVRFYQKGGADDKILLQKYNLYIQNEDAFTLNDNGRILTFEKVK